MIGSGIDKAEIVENSKAVLDVLEFVDKQKEQQKPKPAPAAVNPEVAKLMAQAAEMGKHPLLIFFSRAFFGSVQHTCFFGRILRVFRANFLACFFGQILDRD